MSAPVIDTGSSIDRVSAAFRTVHEAAAQMVRASDVDASLYAYGSVVTGRASVPTSDVDLLTIGLDTNDASRIAHSLSERFDAICRGVEIAAAHSQDFIGSTDEAYGNRVFLRHYCVLLAGPDDLRPTHNFVGDRRAARGFNGDIALHARHWHGALVAGDEPAHLIGRRMARKSLLAAAGLVSVSDGTWTTSRRVAADRWGEIAPDQRAGLAQLLAWASEHSGPKASAHDVHVALDTTVFSIVSAFSALIGLWAGDHE